MNRIKGRLKPVIFSLNANLLCRKMISGHLSSVHKSHNICEIDAMLLIDDARQSGFVLILDRVAKK